MGYDISWMFTLLPSITGTLPAGSVLVGLALMFNWPVQGQVPTDERLYQIVSGTYSESGGIAGGGFETLPSNRFGYISLSTDPVTHTSELKFLTRNLRSSFPTLTNGTSVAEQLRFRYLTVFPSPATNITTIDYTVSTNADTIIVDGFADISYRPCACTCSDCLTGHQHTLVVAIIVPMVTIRIAGGPELCWKSEENRNYQVYYSTNLTTNAWMPWEAPVAGTGGTICVSPAPIGECQSFYRVAAIQ